jgi:predicted short-subunit dehydrogenase-like oxidoreductase (DUF2520 family)
MDIVLIGTGNTATVLGKKLKQAGHTIVQVAGRRQEAVHELAAALDASPCYERSTLSRAASFYLLAVSDNALPGIVHEWALPDRLVAHTAGSVSIDVLKEAGGEYGVLYPLQSMRREITVLPEMPLLVDGNNDSARRQLLAIGRGISAQVSVAGDEQRRQLHLAAVVVNNFTNHLYALADDYCRQHGLDFHYLLPLIRETAARLDGFSPREVQTGPAIRNDTATIEKHLALLKDDERLREVYLLMTKCIGSGRTDA